MKVLWNVCAVVILTLFIFSTTSAYAQGHNQRESSTRRVVQAIPGSTRLVLQIALTKQAALPPRLSELLS